MLAKGNNLDMNIVYGNALNIPFKTQQFDMVFTSGVLIHVAPENLSNAIREIYYTSKKYIWCFEYHTELNRYEEIIYRGNKNRLWSNDFLRKFINEFPNIKVIKQHKFVRKDGKIDMMFLLEK